MDLALAAWDTSALSRLQPGSGVEAYVLERAALGDPVHVAAPAVSEVIYGYERKAADDPRFSNLIAWFTQLLATNVLQAVPFDERAAVVAGRLRATAPHPPGRARRDLRSKTMRQASWLMDIQIVATAFAAGLEVATRNRADFEHLGGLLAELYPGVPPLVVTEPPAPASDWPA
jgi:predicted nucleic acid-binding protein